MFSSHFKSNLKLETNCNCVLDAIFLLDYYIHRMNVQPLLEPLIYRELTKALLLHSKALLVPLPESQGRNPVQNPVQVKGNAPLLTH